MDINWKITLKVWWSMTWRVFVLTFCVGAIVGYFSDLTSLPEEGGVILGGCLAVLFFYSYSNMGS
ncbi:MAG: hypothetical protein HRT94_05960 [Alphaproteobacteria bacterium]|nr:hypothetical protein [Alphaproteobacteria bacterium]